MSWGERAGFSAEDSWTSAVRGIESLNGTRRLGQATYRRGGGLAGARGPLPVARAPGAREASRRLRLPARRPHGVLSYRAHDPALRRWHPRAELPPAPLACSSPTSTTNSPTP